MRFRSFLHCLGLLCCGLLVVGCGGGDGNVAPVEGVVKLDGQPLADAKVEFIPKGGGRPSTGFTDSSGRYELKYTAKTDGALVGEHVVKIRVGRNDDDLKRKEVVPARYNFKSELVGKVESKDNEIDFDLKSGGEIIQPGKEPKRRGPCDCPDCSEDW